MKKISLLLVLIVAVLLIGACSKKASSSRSNKVPITTFYDDMMPLLQARCSPCHMPSKNGNKANFEDYESAKKYGADMLVRVQLNPGEKGFMPFRNAKLTAEQIAVIKAWVDQGLAEK